MNVLLVAPRATGIGGVAYHVSTLARKLVEEGFKVKIYSCENTPHIPIKGLMNPSFTLASTLKALIDLPYPPKPYDVVHAHNIPSAPAMKASWAKKRILTLHGVYREQVEELHRWLPPRLTAWVERKALSWAHTLTAVSIDIVQRYSKLGYRVHHVPNAVELDKLPSNGIKLYEPQIAYLGRLSREKGVDLLIQAFKKMPSYHLLIIGGGPEENKLRRLAQGRSNIHFLGPLPRQQALKYVKGSDMLIQPSRREGLSTSILEAMAMGVPVVATSVGGNTELIKHQATGLLIKPNSVASIIEAVETLIANPSLAKNLAAQAKRHVAAHYSWDKALRQYIKLYEEAVG
ncbi:glycosyl transferase family 1 [Candidatus Geothermarchaeota archaeon ex4572_27]|nr:MAG: glycosyl transferase family 1 [Candidatus Geothermarchaeota archaeon ex4572_27]